MKRKSRRGLPCEYCEGVVRSARVRDDHWTHEGLVIIENVPIGLCDLCGERYYDQRVLDGMQRIASRRSRIRRTIRVPVARYRSVA